MTASTLQRLIALANHLDIRALKCHNFYHFTVSNFVTLLKPYEYKIIPRLLYCCDAGNVDGHGRDAPRKFRLGSRRFRSQRNRLIPRR